MTSVTLKLIGEIQSSTEIAISRPGRGDNMAPKKIVDRSEHYFVPGSSFKGKTRGAMVDLVCRDIVAKGLDLMTYLEMARNAVGGVKGKDTGTPSPQSILDLQRANPIIDACGSGEPVFSTGRIVFEDMVSRESVGVGHRVEGVRANPFTRNPDLIGFLKDADQYNEMLRVNEQIKPYKDAINVFKGSGKVKKRPPAEVIEKALTKLSAIIGEEITEKDVHVRHDELVERRKALGGSSNSLLMPLPSIEVIPIGTFDHRIRVTRAHPSGVGMMIRALEHMAPNFRIGGLQGRGCGFIGSAVYRAKSLENGKWVDAGVVSIIDDEFSIDAPEGGILTQCLNEFDEKLQANAFDFRFTEFDKIIAEADEDE